MHINNIKSEGKESSKNFKSSKVVKETATNKLNIGWEHGKNVTNNFIVWFM